MNRTALLTLVWKDLLIFFSDRRAVLMSFAAPIAIASFFGFIFGGQAGQPRVSKIAVLLTDKDGSAISREIVEGLSADPAIGLKSVAEEAARDAVRHGKAVVGVIIPSGFGEAASKAFFRSAQKPELDLLYDPSHGAELGMVRGILTQYVMQSVSKAVFSGPQGQASLEDAIKDLDRATAMPDSDKRVLRDMFQSIQKWYGVARRDGDQTNTAMPGLSMPYNVREEAITARKDVAYNGFAHAFAGMGVQFMLFMALEIGISILTQRRRGLWQRLRAAPLSRHMLLWSRAMSGSIIALFILLAGFALGRIVFGVRIEGSLVGFFGVCIACALMASTFGLLIAALGKTPEATRGLAIFATLIMVMLRGAWVPAFIFPSWLQTITLGIPTRWAVDGLEAMTWRGLNFRAALGPIAALLTFALLFGAVAVTRFRWDAE